MKIFILMVIWLNPGMQVRQIVPGNAITLANPINFIIGQDLPTNKYLTVDDEEFSG